MRGPARHGYPRCCLTYATEALAPRVATEADADLVTRVLVDAFRGDPMWGTRAFPKRRGRRANRHVVFRTFVAGALRYPATWVTPGDAVAMWTPPGGAGLTTEQEVQLEADLRAPGAGRGGRGAPDLRNTRHVRRDGTGGAALLPVAARHRPGVSGRGYGQRLLAHNLAAIDTEGAAAYLDCADELAPLYTRFGFSVTGSFFLPDGPRSNGMWRAPVGR